MNKLLLAFTGVLVGLSAGTALCDEIVIVNTTEHCVYFDVSDGSPARMGLTKPRTPMPPGGNWVGKTQAASVDIRFFPTEDSRQPLSIFNNKLAIFPEVMNTQIAKQGDWAKILFRSERPSGARDKVYQLQITELSRRMQHAGRCT